MCFSSPKPPKTPAPVQRDEKASEAQFARATTLRARGALDTVGSSTLGDPSFGSNVRVTKLGMARPGPNNI